MEESRLPSYNLSIIVQNLPSYSRLPFSVEYHTNLIPLSSNDSNTFLLSDPCLERAVYIIFGILAG